MGRRSRATDQVGWHHVTNRGAARRDVFVDDADRLEFGRLVGEAHDRFGVGVWAYCLMSNHFHLVLDCRDGGMSDFMQHVSSVFTRHSNERHGGDGPIFRGRFFSRPILSHEYLVAAIRYVHRNPLAFTTVDDLSRYRWSSHRAYLGLRPAPPWLRHAEVLRWFDGPVAFDRWVRSDRDGRMTGHDAASVVALAHQIVAEAELPAGRASQGLARTLAILMLDHVADPCRSDLTAHLSFSGAKGADRAKRRAALALSADPFLQRLLCRLLDLASVAPCNLVSDTWLLSSVATAEDAVQPSV